MKEQLLMILEKNARLSVEQLASLLNATPQQVAAEIEKLEKEGTILGYRSIIDWDKTDRDVCHARIEVQVTPQGGVGFEDIAALYKMVAEVEAQHRIVFQYLYDGVRNGTLYKSEKPILWICSECGYMHVATEAWKVCPLCKAEQGYVDLHLPFEGVRQ
jgi:DNA-binding Lrp family transcriptional regulator